ncbi:MAG: VOC family protein [SAR324 cluster bacterium]|nr:VOC family protein [SAR324 cluster bacterium]
MTDAALPTNTAAGTAPDTGALIRFDHVNLRVDDHRTATAFFIEGLGLTRDPYRMVGTGNMWVNAGRQQFHLPIGQPTPFPGVIMLGVPDLDTVREGLGRVSDALRGTDFSWREDDVPQPDGDVSLRDGGGAILTTTPWGHAIRIYQAGVGTDAPVLGLSLAVFRVPPGAAAGIARFYRDWLHCPVRETSGAATRGAATKDAVTSGAETARVEVTVGPNQVFRFEETTADENPADEGPPGNHHVAVYLTRYREIHQTLADNGLVTEPHRNGQFRFNEIVDPENGARLFRLEHEMRSLYHRDYGRPLVNRDPSWETRV